MRRQRVTILFVVLMAGFAVVQVRLMKLQLVEAGIWSWESRRSAMTFDSLPFERGWILDRNGEPLARTEELRDVIFRYRSWRRGAVVGQAAQAVSLLDDRRRTVLRSLADVEEHLQILSDLEIETLVATGPRTRRGDLIWYLGRIFGREVGRALETGLADNDWVDALRVSDLPGWEQGARDALLASRAEREALEALAGQAGITTAELIAALDEAIAAIDRRVDRFLQRKLASGEVTDAFEGERDLRKTFEGDPAVVLSPVPYDTQTLVALRGDALPGFAVRTERRRTYPESVANLAPLIIGRVGMPSQADVDRAETNRLRLSDLATLEDMTAVELAEYEHLRVLVREIDYTYTEQRGVLGLEKALEAVLRGKRGYSAVVPTADGRRAVENERVGAQRGLNVTLTLDAGLQAAAERALDKTLAALAIGERQLPGVPGAIVLLDPRNGALRAMATSPRPTREALASDYGALIDDALGPLKQRTLQPGSTGNLPPPGSTFKAVVALAGLAEGKITPGEPLECTKTLTVGTQTLGCLFHHGPIDMETALSKSCNIYFYRLAERVGGERLLDWAHRFGFGRAWGLVRGNEELEALGVPVASGLHESVVPLATGRLGRSETMRLGIGQAPLDDVTPLQMALMAGAVGHGTLRPPSLVASIEGYGSVPPREAIDLGLQPAHLDAVRAGLSAVAENGTAAAKLDHALMEKLGVTVAGKTGTPQVYSLPDHSWFVGYLPRKDPVLAFAIFLEHTGEHGGDSCVPVFNDLLANESMQFYLSQELRP